MKFKSLALIGAITAVATPIAVVVSCSEKPTYLTYQGGRSEVKNKILKNKVEEIRKQIGENSTRINSLKHQQFILSRYLDSKSREIENSNIDRTDYNEAVRLVNANADDITKANLAMWQDKLVQFQFTTFGTETIPNLFNAFIAKQIALIKLRDSNPNSDQIKALELEVNSTYTDFETAFNKANDEMIKISEDLKDFFRSEISTDLADKAAEQFKNSALDSNKKMWIDTPLFREVVKAFSPSYSTQIEDIEKFDDELVNLNNYYVSKIH